MKSPHIFLPMVRFLLPLLLSQNVRGIFVTSITIFLWAFPNHRGCSAARRENLSQNLRSKAAKTIQWAPMAWAEPENTGAFDPSSATFVTLIASCAAWVCFISICESLEIFSQLGGGWTLLRQTSLIRLSPALITAAVVTPWILIWGQNTENCLRKKCTF